MHTSNYNGPLHKGTACHLPFKINTQSHSVCDSPGRAKGRPSKCKREQVSILPFNRTDRKTGVSGKINFTFKYQLRLLPDFYDRMKEQELCLPWSCLTIFFFDTDTCALGFGRGCEVKPLHTRSLRNTKDKGSTPPNPRWWSRETGVVVCTSFLCCFPPEPTVTWAWGHRVAPPACDTELVTGREVTKPPTE